MAFQTGEFTSVSNPPNGFATLPTRSVNDLFFTPDTAPLAANAEYDGPAHNAGLGPSSAQPYAYFNALFLTDQAGTGYIDGSVDGETWVEMATGAIVANTPLILEVPVMFQYQRARLVNGAAAQTSLTLKTSYTGA